MGKVKFSSVEEFSKHIIETLKYIRDEYPVISVYGKYETIKEVLESLIASGVKIGKSIELEDLEITGYDKEFQLSLTEDGVNVDKMYHEDNEWHEAGYYETEANIAFVHEDCNSKILSHICADTMYEFAVGECECSECKCKDREVKPVVKEKYTINGKEVSKKTYDESVKDTLERFHEMLDELEEFRKIFFW